MSHRYGYTVTYTDDTQETRITVATPEQLMDEAHVWLGYDDVLSVTTDKDHSVWETLTRFPRSALSTQGGVA